MLGRLAFWRHGVVLASVAACSILAFSGIIGAGNRSERFQAKQVVVWPVGANGLRVREVVDEDFGAHDRHGYQRVIPIDFGVPDDVVASSPDAPRTCSLEPDVYEGQAATGIRVGDPTATVERTAPVHPRVHACPTPASAMATSRSTSSATTRRSRRSASTCTSRG